MNNKSINMTTTFATKCYEKDWEILIKQGGIKNKINNLNYNFDKRVLLINNVNDINLVKQEADKLISQNIIDEYYVVEEHADKVLEKFNIIKESFNGGYYYSIAELTSIHLCNTDYLLQLTGDTICEEKNFNWIDKAINTMENNPKILVANATWNFKYYEAKSESFDEDEDWYYGYGFSDQCYLIKTSNFNQSIYNEHNPISDRYPSYGGELFEKRVDSYMRNKELYRITSKHIAYEHPKY